MTFDTYYYRKLICAQNLKLQVTIHSLFFLRFLTSTIKKINFYPKNPTNQKNSKSYSTPHFLINQMTFDIYYYKKVICVQNQKLQFSNIKSYKLLHTF